MAVMPATRQLKSVGILCSWISGSVDYSLWKINIPISSKGVPPKNRGAFTNG